MIPPQGNTLVDRVLSERVSDEFLKEHDDELSITLDTNHYFDFLNIARGVYSPLTGFMNRNNFR